MSTILADQPLHTAQAQDTGLLLDVRGLSVSFAAGPAGVHLSGLWSGTSPWHWPPGNAWRSSGNPVPASP